MLVVRVPDPRPDPGLAKSQLELVEKLMKDVDVRSVGGAIVVAMVAVLLFTAVVASFNTTIAIGILVFGLAVIGLLAWLAIRLGLGTMDSKYYDRLYENTRQLNVEEPVPSTEGGT